MLLLTPFVTLLRIRVEANVGAIIHTPLWPIPVGSNDFLTALPQTLEAPAPVSGVPDLVAIPGEQPRTVFLARGSHDLAVHRLKQAAFLRSHSVGRFPYLLIGQADLANLRDLLASRWVDHDGVAATPWPCPSFSLDLGTSRVDLTLDLPILDGAACHLVTNAGPLVLTRRGKARQEILLCPAPPETRPNEAASREAFDASPDQTLPLPGEHEILSAPMTVCEADRKWLYERPYLGIAPITGRYRCTPRIVRHSNKFVMLARWCEGIVFDEHGIYSEFGYTRALGDGTDRFLPMPDGMRCERDRLFLDRDVLASAPRLCGPHITFSNPNFSNYTHWLIDALLPLLVMLDHTPTEAKLLLPGTLRGFGSSPLPVCDHHDILRAFGFAELPAVEVAAPFCHVEDLYWLDDCFIPNMPSENIRALRARVASLRPPARRRDRRLYIARRRHRQVSNIAEMQPLLDQNGFTTHTLDDLSVDEQIELFSHAQFVISPHGAELGNLLFCHPGTKVLELAPDCHFLPYFSYMSSKLGLTHAILPCPTDTNDFKGTMHVDIRKFTSLFRMLRIHL
jgi:capsular polysaccharide biosynthesis protein